MSDVIGNERCRDHDNALSLHCQMMVQAFQVKGIQRPEVVSMPAPLIHIAGDVSHQQCE